MLWGTISIKMDEIGGKKYTFDILEVEKLINPNKPI
jgi:hypothetical protein